FAPGETPRAGTGSPPRPEQESPARSRASGWSFACVLAEPQSRSSLQTVDAVFPHGHWRGEQDSGWSLAWRLGQLERGRSCREVARAHRAPTATDGCVRERAERDADPLGDAPRPAAVTLGVQDAAAREHGQQ